MLAHDDLKSLILSFCVCAFLPILFRYINIVCVSGLCLWPLHLSNSWTESAFDKGVLPVVACGWYAALFRVSMIFLWKCWTQDFDITFGLFPVGTSTCSLLLKSLPSNGRDCKHTGRRSFCLYPAQEKINLSSDLTNQSSPGKHPFHWNSISLRFTHRITFKKLLCLPRRAISGLIL